MFDVLLDPATFAQSISLLNLIGNLALLWLAANVATGVLRLIRSVFGKDVDKRSASSSSSSGEVPD